MQVEESNLKNRRMESTMPEKVKLDPRVNVDTQLPSSDFQKDYP